MLSTNRVAQEAGVSVGSLYQYFPNKESLVNGLVERWSAGMGERLARLGAELAEAPVAQAVERIVQATLEEARSEAPLNRVVLMQLSRLGAIDSFERLHRRMADTLADWIAARRSELDVDDPSLAAWVIVATLDSVTDYALLTRPELLSSRRFARELEKLVLGGLGLGARQPSSHASRSSR